MDPSLRYRSAKRATIVNACINSLLAIFKVIIGFIGHSQALIADGLHSFSDLITDVIVLLAAKFGGESPDNEHPYGHRRIETLASIIISFVLIAVAFGIAWDTLHHITSHTGKTLPSYPVIIVAIVSILANEFLYHYTLYEANKSDSELLRNNAWHNRSDALVSIIVLVSVVGTLLGAHYLDAIGAFIISLLILKMGIKMIWQSVQELIDAGVEETKLQQIRHHVMNTPGVIAIHQLRTRSHGNNILLDTHIQVDPYISVSEGHYISEQVHLGLLEKFDKIIDVTVHIDPEDDETCNPCKDLPSRETIEQHLQRAWENIPSASQVINVVIHYLDASLFIDIILPLSVLNDTDTPAQLTQQYKDAINHLKPIQSLRILYADKSLLGSFSTTVM